MMERPQQRIQQGRSVSNRKLAPLADTTLERRVRGGVVSRKLLIERGKMLKSIRFRVMRGRQTTTIVEPRSREEQGLIKIHQEGTRGHGGGTPREVVGINTTDERTVRKFFSDYVSKTLDTGR
jgi:hypothetical protein